MSSLDEHNVYQNIYGPILDDDDPPTKDSVTAGFHSATASPKNPITDYNENFTRLQDRRRMIPVSVQAQNLKTGNPPFPSHQQPPSEMPPPTPNIPPVPPSQTTDDPFTDDAHPSELFFDGLEDNELMTEYEQILYDLENEVVEPTLSTLGMEDVELDMDNVFTHDGDVYEDLDSESDSGDE